MRGRTGPRAVRGRPTVGERQGAATRPAGAGPGGRGRERGISARRAGRRGRRRAGPAGGRPEVGRRVRRPAARADRGACTTSPPAPPPTAPAARPPAGRRGSRCDRASSVGGCSSNRRPDYHTPHTRRESAAGWGGDTRKPPRTRRTTGTRKPPACGRRPVLLPRPPGVRRPAPRRRGLRVGGSARGGGGATFPGPLTVRRAPKTVRPPPGRIKPPASAGTRRTGPRPRL
jgi:hypothetical protein